MNFDKNNIYILPLLLLLFITDLFHPFDSTLLTENPNSYILLMYNFEKIIPLGCFAFLIFRFYRFSPYMLSIYLVFGFFFIFMTFESIYEYNSFLKYPHVILKIMDIFILLAVFSYYLDHPKVNLKIAMNILILGLFMKIAINPSMISVEAFVSHERGLPAASVFVLSLPCLYFFNVYATELKISSLIKFFILFTFIILANHRTVWVTIAFSLILNLFILRKNKNFKFIKLAQSAVLVSLIGFFVFALLISYFPEIEDKIILNITNISNPEKDATAGWRILQMESYWPFIERHFLTGMRWKGFELPIQFYNPDAGIPYFDDGSGHHFHSFYFDKLFYFGLIGLFLFLAIMLYPIYMVIKYSLKLDNMQLSLFIFFISGFIYGISYDLTFSYWVFGGVTISLIEYLRIEKLNDLKLESPNKVSA